MKTILLTGASGNIGQAMLRHIPPGSSFQLFLACRREAEKESSQNYLFFDFDRLKESRASLEQTDILFLLRPPPISDVQGYFSPLLQACREAAVKHIIFLLVQEADSASFISHAKIEKFILKSGIPYTFIRHSYFMQNLSTPLRKDILEKNETFLPAGSAPFLWVDVNDIGKAIAKVLEVPTPCILVRTILHFLPRLQKPPAISNDFYPVNRRTARQALLFLEQHRNTWL